MTFYEDEIDLRRYILALIHHWWQIGLLTLIFAIAGFTFTILQSRTYEATATMLLTRSRASLSLAEDFRTVSEPIDARSRMDALLSIAQSDALALKTLQSLSDTIPLEGRDLTSFQKMVSVSSQGDVIDITAIAEKPDLATEIANTWAQEAVNAINQAYSEEQPLVEIQNQLLTAEGEYQGVQAELELFIENNQIALLLNQIVEAETLLKNISGVRVWQISYYTARKQDMEDLGVQAEALKQQLLSGNRSEAGNLGNSLAVLMARSSALGIAKKNQSSNIFDGDIVLNFQLNDSETLSEPTTNYVDDLDTLIRLARQEKERANKTLDALTEEVFNGDGFEDNAATAAQIQQLKMQLENEEAKERELISQRDLAWEAYQALARKETEILNSTQTSSHVNLATPAISPEKPVARGTITNTFIAGVFGLMLGVVWVVASEWWNSSNQEQ